MYTHDDLAPYWAIAFALFLGTGLASINFDLGSFGSGSVIDMVGPAWSYILFRGLFTSQTDNIWTRFFIPTTTFLIFLFVCFGIEALQYLELYDSTYDPWDLLAYISLLLPLYLLDSHLLSKTH